jgi:hypothetical protein
LSTCDKWSRFTLPARDANWLGLFWLGSFRMEGPRLFFDDRN